MTAPTSGSNKASEISTALIEMWRVIVPTERALSGDDSPRESGGDSLALLRFISMIEEKWHVQLTIREMFSDPDFEALARMITARLL